MKPPLETFNSFTLWARQIIHHSATRLISGQRKLCLQSWMTSFCLYPYLSRQIHLSMKKLFLLQQITIIVLAEYRLIVHFCCWTIVNPLKGIQHKLTTGMWLTLPLTQTPIDLYSVLNMVQWKAPSWPPGEAPVPRLWLGKCTASLDRPPILPCTWNTNNLSYTTTRHNRTLPVCGDTYPCFFLLHALLHWLHFI